MRWLRMIVIVFVLPIAWPAAHVWHPPLHPGQPDIVRAIPIDGNAPLDPPTFALSSIPDPRMPMDREHLGY
jgi:hypothetical protein